MEIVPSRMARSDEDASHTGCADAFRTMAPTHLIDIGRRVEGEAGPGIHPVLHPAVAGHACIRLDYAWKEDEYGNPVYPYR